MNYPFGVEPYRNFEYPAPLISLLAKDRGMAQKKEPLKGGSFQLT